MPDAEPIICIWCDQLVHDVANHHHHDGRFATSRVRIARIRRPVPMPQPLAYRCAHCDRWFADMSTLTRHSSEGHPGKMVMGCVSKWNFFENKRTELYFLCLSYVSCVLASPLVRLTALTALRWYKCKHLCHCQHVKLPIWYYPCVGI